MPFVKLCCRGTIYVQHVSVLIPHYHVQLQQLIACVNDGSGQHFHFFHLVRGQISGKDLRSQVDQVAHLLTYWMKALVV